ncbi:MAG: pilus assembly protein TadG-related protein [Chloroflexi bacterium]|nr:pilus assembly protein TadG-related protein [Chloroflexota bacterium]
MHPLGRPGVPSAPRSGTRGQVLVLVAAGMVAVLVVVGLVVDGGYAFAQQRGSQNGADAAATAGALVIAQNLPFRALGQAGTETDADVAAAVHLAATSNALGTVEAFYTDIDGNLLSPAVRVGDLGASPPPTAAWGVAVTATKAFDTFFARVVGIFSVTSTTDATAVAGYAESAGAGNVLPVTIPLNIIECLNNGKFSTLQPPTIWPLNEEVILPLCKGPASGNVGWLDWTPPGGGVPELRDAILHPSNPAIPIPSWQYVTQTGNINAGQIEDALNTYVGETVLIPFFDNACTEPNAPGNSDCPEGSGPGTGQGNWYHMPLFFGFRMQDVKAAFIQGQNPECGSEWAGAGCLIGTITNYVGPNVTIGSGTGTSLDAYSAVGVQLIR